MTYLWRITGAAVIAVAVLVGSGLLGDREVENEEDLASPNPTAETGQEPTRTPESEPSATETPVSNDPAPEEALALDNERCVSGNDNAETALSGRTIIVDPGHGGEDLGTVNVEYELTESELVLPISEKLRDRLVDSGANVCLTRIDDYNVELIQRAIFANENDGDAFVSVHLNRLPDVTENYSMTMYADEIKDRALAETLLPILAEEMATPEEFEGKPNPMNPEVTRIEHLESSMLYRAEMPAVLVEAAFLSNPWEAESYLAGREDESYWRKNQVADALHRGLLVYFEEVD